MLHDCCNKPRELPWGRDSGEVEKTKKVILDILKEQKVSLSETRYLFHCILEDIEDKNPITL